MQVEAGTVLPWLSVPTLFFVIRISVVVGRYAQRIDDLTDRVSRLEEREPQLVRAAVGAK